VEAPRSPAEQIAVDGPEASADPWRRQYSAAGYVARVDRLAGRYAGTGVRLRVAGDSLVVDHVTSGTPAHRAGIVAGERVVAVDGHRVTADDLASVLRALRSASAPVAATFEGVDGRAHDVVMSGTVVVDPGVRVAHAEGPVVVAVPAMVAGAAESVRASVAPHRTADVVLDLRGNAGGLVAEAVAVAGVFIDGGPGAMYPRGDGSVRVLDVPRGGAVHRGALVVLVDEGTASAAELLAGLLQDRGRAVVVGRTTFGKGVVQEPMPTTEGVTEVSVGRYVLPSGRTIDQDGLRPDAVVAADASDAAVLRDALDVLRGLDLVGGAHGG
jgi:carboxyl-terminal processing protease